jgi:hypothetical protein
MYRLRLFLALWVILPLAMTASAPQTASQKDSGYRGIWFTLGQVIYVEDDGTWKIIGPTERGPQPVGSGGEIALWTSRDQGRTWRKDREVTRNSAVNHNYARRPLHAHPGFYAFWADGDPDKFSPSHLYFTNRAGDRVWRLPYDMDGESATPELISR